MGLRWFLLWGCVVLGLAGSEVSAQEPAAPKRASKAAAKRDLMSDEQLSRSITEDDWPAIVDAISKLAKALTEMPDMLHRYLCNTDEERAIRRLGAGIDSLVAFQRGQPAIVRL
jgi:hypothetical protein